jgi:hypothetical protein
VSPLPHQRVEAEHVSHLHLVAMHIKTDVFCSASIILPDKGGRQINIGGWSLDSTFGVRLFTPDGAPGQPSHSDWEEDLNTLKLQVRHPSQYSFACPP